MLNDKNLDKNLWNSIKLHYEKECYTDVVKDACLYLIEMIQDKSERNDLDGEALINTVFSEKNPQLLINNNQTISEKDEQRGFFYILRGIICGMRNPISHTKKIKYSKEESESIILFINNYILRKLDDSKDFGYTDDWFDFIFFKNNNDSKKLSDAILEKMRKKEKYDLMISIVDNLSQIENGKYYYIINELYNSLSKQEKDEIIILLNKKLIDAGDGQYLRKFFNHFDSSIWKKLDNLVRVRIEEMIIKSIEDGKSFENPRTLKIDYTGTLGTWTSNWIEQFSNKNEIIDLLYKKLNISNEADYVINYFNDLVEDRKNLKKYSSKILNGLMNGKIGYKKILDNLMFWNNNGKKDELVELFNNLYNNFDEEIKNDPFSDYEPDIDFLD